MTSVLRARLNTILSKFNSRVQSCSQSCMCESGFTLRDVQPGEEICEDYGLYHTDVELDSVLGEFIPK